MTVLIFWHHLALVLKKMSFDGNVVVRALDKISLLILQRKNIVTELQQRLGNRANLGIAMKNISCDLHRNCLSLIRGHSIMFSSRNKKNIFELTWLVLSHEVHYTEIHIHCRPTLELSQDISNNCHSIKLDTGIIQVIS